VSEKTFSLFEVSELLAVPPHVLSYREREFSLPVTQRDEEGRRIYNSRDVESVRKIKESLYERQRTIAETKRRLAGEHD
jgi:DNA-binding transcriptional MerR regulator